VADFGANIHDIHSWVHKLKRTPGFAQTLMQFAKSSLRVVSDRNVYDLATAVVTGTKKPGDASIDIVVAHDEYPVILRSTTPLVSHLTDVSKYIWTLTMPLDRSIPYLESKLKFEGHAVDSTLMMIQRLQRLEIIVYGKVQTGGLVPRVLDLFNALKICFILDSNHDIDVE